MSEGAEGHQQRKREKWPEWLPTDAPEPAPLITRDELLATLERLRLPDISERTLRFWEAAGVLPAPIQRRHRGATRALYPWWMADLVWQLKRYQDEGFTLEELPGRMRAEARFLAQRVAPFARAARHLRDLDRDAHTTSTAVALAQYLRRDFIDEYLANLPLTPIEPGGPPFAAFPLPPLIEARMSGNLSAVATALEEHHGFAATGAAIVLTDQHGKAISIPIPLHPNLDNPANSELEGE